MSIIDADGTPGGRLVLTADQWQTLIDPVIRRTVISQVPATVELGQPAIIDGLVLFDSPHLTGDDIDLVLLLLDNVAVLDTITEAVPDAT